MTKENFIHCIDEINRNSKYNIQLIYEVIYELAKDSLSYRYSIDIEEIANETLRKISRTSYIELPADQLYNLIKVVASNAANTAFNLAKRKAKFEVSESDVCYEDAEG